MILIKTQLEYFRPSHKFGDNLYSRELIMTPISKFCFLVKFLKSSTKLFKERLKKI